MSDPEREAGAETWKSAMVTGRVSPYVALKRECLPARNEGHEALAEPRSTIDDAAVREEGFAVPKTSQPGSPIEGLAQIPPRPPALDDADRDRLLALTRIALEYATLAGGSDRRPGPGRGSETPWQRLDAALEAATNIGEPAAVFVTLTEYDDLRGCMGNLDRATPLAESVVAAAVTVARHDPRFLPVAPRELPAIHVEISVLGEAVPLVSPEDFEPGVDGVIVECGGRRALLLPEVATDQGWGPTEMFDTVCRKAGLPRDAWRDPGARLLRFRTIRFGGPAVEGAPDL